MNALQKEKRAWLYRARNAESLLRALQQAQKRDMRLIAESPEDEECEMLRQHLDMLQAQTEQEMTKLAAVREEVRRQIATVGDMQLQAILYRKYLAYQKTDQIAEAMYYDIRTIQRKHKQALDMLELPAGEENSGCIGDEPHRKKQ